LLASLGDRRPHCPQRFRTLQSVPSRGGNAPVAPASGEAEAGGPLEPGSSGQPGLQSETQLRRAEASGSQI
jgi:hypothetical protein